VQFGIDGPKVLRYEDTRRGNARHVLVEDGKLAAVMVAGDVTARHWLREALESDMPVAELGRMLLSPSSSAPQGVKTRGKVVCSCLNVAQAEIEQALAEMGPVPDKLGALQARLKCGTNCGSCVPEIKQMIALQAQQAIA
jgi:assimilatory nitrate reductase catalytic subunit